MPVDDDSIEVPREGVVAVYSIDDDGIAVLQAEGEGRKEFTYTYAGFIVTSIKDVADLPQVRAIAEVEELTGEGLRYLLRPRHKQTLFDLREAIAAHPKGTVYDSPYFDAPSLVDAFFFDTGVKLYRGLSSDEVRVAVVHLLVGRSSPLVSRLDYQDTGNVLVGAAIRCGDQHQVLTGDEVEIAEQLREIVEAWAPDALLGFELASFGVRHLDAILSRVGKNGWAHDTKHRRASWGHPYIIDLEALCVPYKRGEPRPRSLFELGAKLGLQAPPMQSPRKLLELRDSPAALRAVAHDELTAAAEMAAQHLPSALYLAGVTPGTLADAVHLPPSVLLAKMMEGAYYDARRALPQWRPTTKLKGGGRVETPAFGRFAPVLHLDVSSAYPMIVATQDLAPTPDSLRAFPRIIRKLIEDRAEMKRLAEESKLSGEHLRSRQQLVVESRIKKLLSTACGTTGWERNRFADQDLRARIAADGRLMVGAMKGAVEDLGCGVLVIETDGMYLTYEPSSHAPETILRAAEAAVNQSIGSSEVRVRCAGPFPAMLVTPTLRLVSGGEEKGWHRKKASRLVLATRAAAVDALLAGDPRAAGRIVTEALDRIESRQPSVRDVALPHTVTDAPGIQPTDDLRAQAISRALLASGAVDGDIVDLVQVGGAGDAQAWEAAELVAEGAWSIAWARSELLQGLALLGRCLPLDAVLGGKRLPRSVVSELSKGDSGPPRTELTAGVKTAKTIIARHPAEYGDAHAEDAFVASYSDAHGLLLGYFGQLAGDDAPWSEFLRSSIRTGDFYMELEHHSSDELPLTAVKACIEVLESRGCDEARDVRVLYNGHRSFLVRVRQSAFGVNNCVDLPRLYARFAEALDAAVREQLSAVTGAVYDEHLYRPTATYRLVGAAHHINGFRATYVQARVLQDTVSLEELRRSAAQGQRPAPFTETMIVGALRSWFDQVTFELPRRETKDPTHRVRSAATVSRAQREQKKRKLHLSVIPTDHAAPCAGTVLSRAERGDSLGFAPLAKAVYELRLQGMGRREIARRLASGLGGIERYAGRVVLRDDGPDLSDDLWPEDIHLSYYRGCGSDEVRQICDLARCYRSESLKLFDETKSPSFEEGRALAYQTTSEIEIPSAPGIRAYEVPPRSGKTKRIAVRAIKAARSGKRVLIFGPTHAALQQAADYLMELDTSGVLVVHLIGREKNRANCRTEHLKRPSCSGCECNASVEVFGMWQPNPKLDHLSLPAEGVMSRSRCRELATDLCARTVSRHAAREAHIVLATFAHLTHERWASMVEGREFEVVFVDEADALFDAITAGGEKMELARSRQVLEHSLQRECDMKCDACRLDFTPAPSLDGWQGRSQVESLELTSSSSFLAEALRKAQQELELDSTLAEYVDPQAMSSNIAALMAALPPADTVRRGHPISPREYAQFVKRHAERDANHAPHVAADSVPSVFVPVVPCIRPEAPRSLDERRWWRHDLLDTEMSGELAGYLELADFLDRAAQIGGGVLLLPRTRPGPWASWQPWCTIELRHVDLAVVRRVRAFLSSKRTVLLSGTLPNRDLLAALFPNVEVDIRSVPMHRDLTVYMHTANMTGHSEPFVPRRYEPDDVLDLVEEVYRKVREADATRRGFRVRIFARSVLEHANLLRAGAASKRPNVTVVRASEAVSAPGKRTATVTVDYLRSPESRAVDIDADLLIVYGSGLPDFTSLAGFRHFLATEGVHVAVDELAEDSRRRAVIQALLRTAALKGRRAVLVINDMSAVDMPDWLLHRVVSAESLYRDLRDDAQPSVADQQRAVLAAAIADAVKPRDEPPTLQEVLDWRASSTSPPSTRLRAANRRRLQGIVARGLAGEALSPSAAIGSKADWGAMLGWLASRGVLTLIVPRETNRYVYVFAEGALAHLSALLSEAEQTRT